MECRVPSIFQINDYVIIRVKNELLLSLHYTLVVKPVEANWDLEIKQAIFTDEGFKDKRALEKGHLFGMRRLFPFSTNTLGALVGKEGCRSSYYGFFMAQVTVLKINCTCRL